MRSSRWRKMNPTSFVLSLLLVLVPNGFAAASAAADAAEEECCSCETCHGFGEWVYGVGWLIPPYETEEIGQCLQQRPLSVLPDEAENETEAVLIFEGQGDAVQEAMMGMYDTVLELGIRPDNNPGDGTSDAAASIAMISRGLQAAVPGATAPNSEGLYYCVTSGNNGDGDGNADGNDDGAKEAFYWVLNCDVLRASANAGLCQDLSDEEMNIGPVGFVVDPALTGSGGFIRYVFNETTAVRTEAQPIADATGFSCSARPWYQMGTQCVDPAKVLCPTRFQGTQGLGTFQVYGDTAEGVVVAQDVATWQLCRCLDDLSCDTSQAEQPCVFGLTARAIVTVTTATMLVLFTSMN